jgi:putative endonuclease
MDVPSKKELGTQAEDCACRYLVKKGLQLITRNYLCKRGEIDLIMRDKDEIVFVEVRTRKNSHYHLALESIDRYKQKKIIAAATHYLCATNRFEKVNCRFDVIGISYAQTKASIEWIKDAFSADNF